MEEPETSISTKTSRDSFCSNSSSLRVINNSSRDVSFFDMLHWTSLWTHSVSSITISEWPSLHVAISSRRHCYPSWLHQTPQRLTVTLLPWDGSHRPLILKRSEVQIRKLPTGNPPVILRLAAIRLIKGDGVPRFRLSRIFLCLFQCEKKKADQSLSKKQATTQKLIFDAFYLIIKNDHIICIL